MSREKMCLPQVGAETENKDMLPLKKWDSHKQPDSRSLRRISWIDHTNVFIERPAQKAVVAVVLNTSPFCWYFLEETM